MSSRLQVRVISPWFGRLETETAVFSVDIPRSEADALLCDWAPSDELATFPRRKAWYCCEPDSQFHRIAGGKWVSIRNGLAASEFLCHDHSNPRFRVPHITHFEDLDVDSNRDRKDRAVAVVSNHGGSPRLRHPGQSYRNGFVTSPLVDLYGRSSWREYRSSLFSRRRPPANYIGELPGDWPANAKRELMRGYKVAIALENMNEPNYFTEKFVEAARAGCIPIYRPDSVSKAGVLSGAAYVDPTDFRDDVTRTIEAALLQDLEEVQKRHTAWFANNERLRASSHHAVFSRIGEILAQ